MRCRQRFTLRENDGCIQQTVWYVILEQPKLPHIFSMESKRPRYRQYRLVTAGASYGMMNPSVLPVAGRKRNPWEEVADTLASDAAAGHASEGAAGVVGPNSKSQVAQNRASTAHSQFDKMNTLVMQHQNTCDKFKASASPEPSSHTTRRHLNH